MPAEVSLPIIERDGFENRIGGLEEIGLSDIDVLRARQTLSVLKKSSQSKSGHELLQLGLRHLVIVFLRIAQLDAGARRLGERSLDGHDGLGVLGRGLARFAEEAVSILVTCAT